MDDNIQNSFPEYVNFVNEQQGSNIVPNVTIGPSSVNNNASNNINDSSNNNNSTPGNNILGTTENESELIGIGSEKLFWKYIHA